MKQYKPGTSCISSGQVLQCPYEIREGSVFPQQFPVFPFVQLGNAHSVFIRFYLFCHDIQCHFAQIQI